MGNSHVEIKKYYEEWWENPEDPRGVVFNALNDLVRGRIQEGSGKKALDVGSGKGKIVSFLLDKGYSVTAVDLNEKFTRALKEKYPGVSVLEGDFRNVSLDSSFDLITAIEFVQNLDKDGLVLFIEKAASLTDRLILNISNRNSLHGFWTNYRGFQKSFVHTYRPSEIERLLSQYHFKITYKRGVGFVTPVTLLSGFRFKIVPAFVARLLNPIADKIFPGYCHLYYIEAEKT
jgi:SAM-dependent methyltransferase